MFTMSARSFLLAHNDPHSHYQPTWMQTEFPEDSHRKHLRSISVSSRFSIIVSNILKLLLTLTKGQTHKLKERVHKEMMQQQTFKFTQSQPEASFQRPSSKSGWLVTLGPYPKAGLSGLSDLTGLEGLRTETTMSYSLNMANYDRESSECGKGVVRYSN